MPKDIKTVNVPMSREAETIRAYQSFGWVLLNNQEIFVKDSHLKRGTFDGKLYSVTETTHYAKLTFERDPATLKNYARIRSLENAYHSVPKPPKKPVVLPKWALAIFIVLGIFFAWIFSVANAGMIGVLFVGIYAGIVYAVQKRGLSKLPAWQEACKVYHAKCEEILCQADQLLQN